MKATLTYNLPEEDVEFKVYMRAYDFYAALNSISELMRQHRKGNIVDIEKMIDGIQDHITESGIYEV